MSAWRPKACRDCELSGSDKTPISKKGYCPECGVRRASEAARSMITKSGEHYDRFARNERSKMGRPRSRGVGGTPS